MVFENKGNDTLKKPDHSSTRIQYIQQFVCTWCGSGGPQREAIFTPTGQCNTCGGPAGKIELQQGERDVDLEHTVLAIHSSNPSEEVKGFIKQLRAEQVRVISLDDVIPSDQPIVFAVKPVEAIVKATPYILAFWTPDIEKNALANLTMDTAFLSGERLVPIYPTKQDFEESPINLRTRMGAILQGPDTEEKMMSPTRVIEQIALAMQHH